MEPLIEKYIHSVPLQMPVEHPNGFKLTDTSVQCKKCKANTEDLKGTVTIHTKCIEIEAGGICHKCKAVTWARFRWYGTYLLHWSDTGIRTLRTPTYWWKTIKKYLKV